MTFVISGTRSFYDQLDELGTEARWFLLRKMSDIETRPFSHKRLHAPGRHLFTVRFTDRGSSKRLIYEVRGRDILLLSILNRKDEYRDMP